MKKFVALDKLVSQETIKSVENIEKNKEQIVESIVRGVKCYYATSTKRQLWQAVGLEYIEPELLDYIDSMEQGSVFYDIGASNGIFSIYAANKGSLVYSFEPEVQNFALLGTNSYLNRNEQEKPMKIFNIALSDTSGMGNMYIAKFEAGGHMKILDKPQKVQENMLFEPDFVQNIIKYGLDEFIEKFKQTIPDYIKIDVDGAEVPVIKGGMKTLKNSRLKSVFIELEDNTDCTAEILKTLEDCGFMIEKKVQVQNYDGLYNFVFTRR